MNKANALQYLKRHYPKHSFINMYGVQAVRVDKPLEVFDQMRFRQTEFPGGGFVLFPTVQHEYINGQPVFTTEDLLMIEKIKQQIKEGPNIKRPHKYNIMYCGKSYSAVRRFIKANNLETKEVYRVARKNMFEVLYPDKAIPENATDEQLQVCDWYVFDIVIPSGINAEIVFRKVPHRANKDSVSVAAKISNSAVSQQTRIKTSLKNMKWENWIKAIDEAMAIDNESVAIDNINHWLNVYHKGKVLDSVSWEYFKELYDKTHNTWLVLSDAAFVSKLTDVVDDDFV